MDRQNKMEYSAERLDAMELVNQAHMLVDVGNLDRAEELLNEAVQKDPMYVKIYIEQGNIWVLRDDYAKAEQSYRDGLLVDKTEGELHFHLGNALLLSDRFLEAIQAYEQAEEAGYLIAVMAENLAYCYEESQMPEQALNAYARAIRMDPENAETRLRRISLQIEMGRLDSALTAAEGFLQRFPTVEEGYECMVNILLQMKEYDRAEAFLKGALEAFPDTAALMVQLGRVYGITDRYQEAHELFVKVREMEDVEEDLLEQVDELDATTFMLQDDADGALKIYSRIIAGEKDGAVRVQARTVQMTLLNTTKRFEELLRAAADAQRTSEADGELCMAYALEPWALENLGKLSEAKELYKNALQKLRVIAIKDASRMDTHLYRAICHRGLGEHDKALKELRFYDDMGVRLSELEMFRSLIYNDIGEVEKANAAVAEAELLKKKARKRFETNENIVG